MGSNILYSPHERCPVRGKFALTTLNCRGKVKPETVTITGRSANSGGECKLVLLYWFLHPGAQSGFLEGSEERLLRAVVLKRCLFGLVVGAGSHGFDPQAG